MANDIRIRDEVSAELDCDPSVAREGIGVAVRKGVVTLSGYVARFSEKSAAVKAAQRVRGVKAVACELLVRLPHNQKRNDDEIAGRALDILRWTLTDPSGIGVVVENGWITLTGTVDWHFQRRQAERAVQMLGGVLGVSNELSIRPRIEAHSIKESIEQAFLRNAALEGGNIQVSVEGSAVTLSGTVKAWHERKMAEDAAWAIPGVQAVIDQIALH